MAPVQQSAGVAQSEQGQWRGHRHSILDESLKRQFGFDRQLPDDVGEIDFDAG